MAIASSRIETFRAYSFYMLKLNLAHKFREAPRRTFLVIVINENVLGKPNGGCERDTHRGLVLENISTMDTVFIDVGKCITCRG